MEKQITKKNMARQNRTFRLSEYELCKLSEDAKAAGMNESKYLRELIVHGGVDATHAEDRRNLIRQISGIATNINQMAKHCNESKWFGNVDVLKMTQALEEGTKEQMYEITRRFAEEFLGGEYEGVFSVHTDKDHLHGHLVYNSVNMVTGRKYSYKKGIGRM